MGTETGAAKGEVSPVAEVAVAVTCWLEAKVVPGNVTIPLSPATTVWVPRKMWPGPGAPSTSPGALAKKSSCVPTGTAVKSTVTVVEPGTDATLLISGAS